MRRPFDRPIEIVVVPNETPALETALLERLLRHYSDSGSLLASQQQVLQKVVS